MYVLRLWRDRYWCWCWAALAFVWCLVAISHFLLWLLFLECPRSTSWKVCSWSGHQSVPSLQFADKRRWLHVLLVRISFLCPFLILRWLRIAFWLLRRVRFLLLLVLICCFRLLVWWRIRTGLRLAPNLQVLLRFRWLFRCRWWFLERWWCIFPRSLVLLVFKGLTSWWELISFSWDYNVILNVNRFWIAELSGVVWNEFWIFYWGRRDLGC